MDLKIVVATSQPVQRGQMHLMAFTVWAVPRRNLNSTRTVLYICNQRQVLFMPRRLSFVHVWLYFSQPMQMHFMALRTLHQDCWHRNMTCSALMGTSNTIWDICSTEPTGLKFIQRRRIKDKPISVNVSTGTWFNKILITKDCTLSGKYWFWFGEWSCASAQFWFWWIYC